MASAMDEARSAQSVMEQVKAVMQRGGYACLGCEKPTIAEGQVCPACVERGIWVENDSVFVSIEVRLPDWMTA